MNSKVLQLLRARKEILHYAVFLLREGTWKELFRGSGLAQLSAVYQDWMQKFSGTKENFRGLPAGQDSEDRLSIHRFRWIPLSLAEGTLPEVPFLDQIRDWIRRVPIPGEGWDSYSIAERLANWLYLFREMSRKGLSIPGDIKTHVRQQAAHLQSHLEDRGEATNNHLINNGRALYLVGHFLEEDSLKSAGAEILTHELGRQFTPSGFLKEGSSHYQLLLTRSYLEVLWQARQADPALFARWADRVRDLWRAAAFFLEMDDLSFIGDVSPDHPPRYFFGLGHVGNALFRTNLPTRDLPGWHRLVLNGNETSIFTSLSSETLSSPWRTVSYPDAGYYSVCGSSYQFLLHANPKGCVGRGSHGHADLGGFILSWKGKPLLVDCGRATFEDNPLGRYGRSVRSHNSISIDRAEPMIVQGLNGFVQLFHPEYYTRPPIVEMEFNCEPHSLTLKIFGYERLHPPILWRRRFIFSFDSLEIEDEITGKESHHLESFFHLHPDVEVHNRSALDLELKAGGEIVSVRNLSRNPSHWQLFKGQSGKKTPAGWYSPEYGRSEATTTLLHEQHIKLPIVNRYRIGVLR